MSKKFHSIAPVFLLILQFFTYADAQDLDATIKIGDSVVVEGRFLTGKHRNLSMLLEYAGVTGLGQRISAVELRDAAGKILSFREMAPGEYLAEGKIAAFSYGIDLSPLKNRTAAAHISWLNTNGGILMLDDLLPQVAGQAATIRIEMPTGWKAYSAEGAGADFKIGNIEKTAIYVGRNLREKEASAGRSRGGLLLSDEWLFTDDEAAGAAGEVFSHYLKVFSGAPSSSFHAAVMKFPGGAPTGSWEADTRGSSVTIISSDMPFKSQSLQRLHEQFRHEIFHLWIPNSLTLTGNYDWFYEGFALYESLKLGVAVNRIRFEDFLDTLSRAHEIDSISGASKSLVELSRQRWSGSNTQIYARGMIIGFLTDLAMLDASKGKRSTDDLVREVYEKHRPPAPAQDGNEALLAIFRSRRELSVIATRYISGAEKIDWTAYINTAGITATDANNPSRLSVIAKPSGRQKDLLDKLGYNNWRRMSNKK